MPNLLDRDILFVIASSVLSASVAILITHDRKPERDYSSPELARANEPMSSGVSRVCLDQVRKSDSRSIDGRVMADQAELQQMGVLSVVTPTSGPLGATKRVVADRRAPTETAPSPTVDILAHLGVTLENQFDGEYGVTDMAIRGMADRAYGKLGIADEDLRGWTLSVRMMEMGANTSFDEDRKLVIVNVGAMEFVRNIEHELTHVLAGAAFTGSERINHVAKEFVSVAGETLDVNDDIRKSWDYDRLNMAILGMGRTINGESGVMHANNVPLDGFRYDLLRLTDEKIGEDGQEKLARDIYALGIANGSLTMDDLRPLFAAAGLGELAILTDTMEPGLYLDMTFMKNGMPMLLAKTIDLDGYEGLTNVPVQLIWRDAKGMAIAGGSAQPISPSMALGDATALATFSSSLEVRVSGQPFTFAWSEDGLHSVSSANGKDASTTVDSTSSH